MILIITYNLKNSSLIIQDLELRVVPVVNVDLILIEFDRNVPEKPFQLQH